MKKRFMSMLVVLCMVFTLFPPAAFAEEAGGETIDNTVLETNNVTEGASPCENHKTHTKDCGYIEDVEGKDCTHECKQCGVETPESSVMLLTAEGDITTDDYEFVKATGTLTVKTTLGTTSWQTAITDNTTVKAVVITSDVTVIGTSAFANCTSLVDITIPNSVIDIKSNAFFSCTSLEDVIFEENSSLTEINERVFNSCTSLKTLEIPASVTHIGYGNPFIKCPLLNLTVDPGNTNFVVENNVLYSKDKTKLIGACGAPTVITLPTSVTSIGKYAFEGCNNLGTVTFEGGSELTFIHDGSFKGCSKLDAITIPAKVTYIGSEAFNGCSKLDAITIPASVTIVGYKTFQGCKSLANVTFEGVTPPTLEMNTFDTSSDLVIHVPEVAKDVYKKTTNFPKDKLAKDPLTGTVTISGTLKFGETLTASIAGDSNASGTLSYQWKRGSNNISTANPYTIVADDVGQTLTCEIKTTEQSGSITGNTSTNIGKADAPQAGDFTVGSLAATYSGTPKFVTVTANGGKDFGTITVKYNGSTTAPTAVGTYAITVSATGSATYESTASDVFLGNFTINKATFAGNLTATIEHIKTDNTLKTYDLSQLISDKTGFEDVTYTIGTTTPGNVLSGNVTLDGSNLNYTLAGTGSAGNLATVTVTVASKNYANVTATITIQLIDKTVVTITGINSVDGTYSGSTQKGYNGSATVTGHTDLNNTLVYTYTSTDGGGYNNTTSPTAVGTYKLMVSVPDSNATYSGKMEVTFSIVKKPVTVSISCLGKPYDGTTVAANVDYTVNGKVGNEAVTATGTASYDNANAGNRTVNASNITLTGANAGNYSLSATTATATSIAISKGTYSPVITKAMDFLQFKSQTGTIAVSDFTLPAGFQEAAIVSVTKNTDDNSILTLNGTNYSIANSAANGNTATCDVVISSNNYNNVTATLTFNIIGNSTVTISDGGNGATGAGNYASGATVNINAGSKSGYSFNGWTTDDVTIANPTQAQTSFIMPDKAVIVTANWTQNGGGSGGGSTGGSSSSSGSSSNITVTPSPDKLNVPTEAEIKVKAKVDSKGGATVNVSYKDVTNAIKKATAEAKKSGDEANGITLVLNATTGNKTVNTLTVNLPKTVQEKVISNKIVSTVVVVDNPDIKIGMDLKAVIEINAQAKSDVTIRSTRMDSNKLTDSAKIAIGNRPVFNLSVNYGSDKQVQNFKSGSVSVSIPYTLQAGEVAGGVYAVYVDGNGKVNYIANSSYDTNAKVLRFATNHFSIYGIGYKVPIAFADIASHWAKSDIEFVTNRGLISGTSDTTFAPNSAMTRGMFVTALGRLAGVDVNSYKIGSFADVKPETYYAPYANWAASNGITNGTTPTTFSPDKNVTRQEMAVMMSNYTKVYGYTVPKTRREVIFADNRSINSWAIDAIKQMQIAGIINGKNGNMFDPTGTATRGEISAMLHRYIELVIDRNTAEGWTINDSGSAMYYRNGKAVTGSKIINRVTYKFNSYGETTQKVILAGKNN